MHDEYSKICSVILRDRPRSFDVPPLFKLGSKQQFAQESLHMWKITSSILQLLVRFVLVMVPVVIVLGLASYWLTTALTSYSRSLQFLGVFPLLIGSGLVFHSFFTPDLKRMARERVRRRERDGDA